MLEVTLCRYRCTGCGHVWRQDAGRAAEPRAKLSRRGLRWALEGIVHQHLTVARVAEGPGVAWHTANDAVLAEGKRALIDHPDQFDGVTAIGVDEHARRRTERGGPCAPVQIPSPRSSRTGSRRCSPPHPHRGRDDMVDPPADDRGPPARRSPPGTRIDGQADNSISSGAPKSPAEIITPGRTPKNRAVDAPARFDRSGASNGPTEAINGRLEHLCGSALGFRNFTNCIARSLSLSHRERRCSKPADSDPDHTLDCE